MENTSDLMRRLIPAAREGAPWFCFDVDNWTVHIRFGSAAEIEGRLEEAKHKGKPIGGHYSAQLHAPHWPDGQKHLHVYARNNQIFALNVDGSAHDKSHQTEIPAKVADGIRQHFPDFAIPANNFIEWAQAADVKALFG